MNGRLHLGKLMRNTLNQALRSLLFVAVLPTAVLLIGCGGNGGSQAESTVNPYNGLKYSGNSLPLGTEEGSLALNVAPTTISGSLIVSAVPRAKGASGPLKPATVTAGTYSFSGSFTGASPTFSANFSNLTNSTIAGMLPKAPATTGGSFTLTINGTVYGPFTFGATSTTSTFHVDEIGLLTPGGYSHPMDLNDNGEVVGGATDASGNGHAFTWTKKGGLVDLGLFGGLGASANAVSNGGVVVGVYEVLGIGQNVFRPFIVGASNPTPGTPPGCDDVNVEGVTNAGLMFVGGYFYQNGSEDPVGTFVYSGGKYQPIGVPSKVGISQIKAFGKDAVFGYYGSQTGPATSLWKWDGTSSILFDWDKIFQTPMPGWGAVGPEGEALGTLKNGDAGYLSPDGSSSTDTGHAGVIIALNASGQAVGNFTTSAGQRGFFWTKAGGFKDLNTMIDPSLGVTIFAAVGINAKGQIICFTKDKNVASGLFGIGALLTPN